MKKALSFLFAGLFLAFFCLILSPATSAGDSKPKPNGVTFSKDVAPVFFKHCADCHHPNDLAPMSLVTYKEARPWARAIKEKVINREMPPWHADPHYGQFSNNRRLTDEEIATIVAWVDQGAKEGNPKDLPATPVFREGWKIGKPDVVLSMQEEYTIEAKTHGFNKKTLKHVFLAKPKPSSPTAHVQIRLQPSGPFNYNK